MSKVFEEEYKKLAENEIPDLWDRIEAGLSEKKPVLTTESDINKNSNNKTVLIFFKRYQTVAAALLCVMILVPAFFLMRQMGGSMNKSSSETAMDTAPAEMMEAAAEEAVAEAPAAEAPAEEMMVEETCEEMTAATVTEAKAEEAMESETAAGMVENAEMETAKDLAMKEEMKQSAENKRAEAVLYQVSVKVIQKQEIDSVPETDFVGGSIYQCVVVGENGDGQLEINDEITVYVPTLLAEELVQGEVYELDLTESTSKYYDYTAKSLYN